MKRKILSLTLALVTLFSVCACNMTYSGAFDSSKDDKERQNENNYQFESVFSDADEVTLQSNESKSFAVNTDISGKEYIKLTLQTNANLLGEFTYRNAANSSQVVKEEFFIEPSDKKIEFKQFLDAFRDNGVGLFDKYLISVTLKNLDNHAAGIRLSDISVADREVPAHEKEIYIEKEGLKVGADLAMGGTLSYLEKTSWEGLTVDEVIDYDNNVYIGVNAKEDAAIELSSSVNLINICDAGREFQQSYYAAVGGSTKNATGANGYDRRWSYTATREGYYWPYNPVQGGDEVCNLSQIIDYEVADNYIYVKVRAMDWANGNARPEHKGDDYEEVKFGRTTKSYIESWYTIKDGMLFVDNRFIDWNGFTDMENIPEHTLEIPAAYVVHPLSTYVCYTGHDPWNLEDTAYDVQPELLGWWDSNAHINNYHPENWFAWVNDEEFGVGVYIPGAGSYVSGRNDVYSSSAVRNNQTAYESKMATDYLFNKKAPTSKYTSCYVGNTSYTAPVVSVRMKEYIPISYSYAVAVDYLDIMRKDFKEIYEKGEMTNQGLKAWD